MPTWELISDSLRTQPLFSVVIEGEPRLRVERYFYQGRKLQSPPMDCCVLGVLLGGCRLRGGIEEKILLNILPGTSVFVSAGNSCRWEFMGAIDFALFYFLDSTSMELKSLLKSQAASDAGFIVFNDPLIHHAALHLSEESARGAEMDTKFISPLRAVILEQLARVMTGTAGHYIRVDSLQLGRLTQLLDWIKQNLNQPMGNYALAERLGVSESHFRRIFQETMHCTPHRFIMQLRLERVRQLLTSTTLSIPRIASECGFES